LRNNAPVHLYIEAETTLSPGFDSLGAAPTCS
jgi:hypothetical protein